MLCCYFTSVLSELHHSLHGLRVCQSHEPEELSPPTALMEIHLYGLLFLLKHLKAVIKINDLMPPYSLYKNVSRGADFQANKIKGAQNIVNLSLVRACASVQMEESVTVSAQVATHVAEDDGCCLAIIMVVTHGLWKEEEINIQNCYSFAFLKIVYVGGLYGSNHLLLLSIFAHPATRGQSVNMVLVQHTQGG